MKRITVGLFAFMLAVSSPILAQEKTELKFNLNENGSHYVKGTLLNQIWIRNTQLNPGSSINGYAREAYTDISIRRLRFQVLAQLTDRVFFYTQFGQNNFNFRSDKYTGSFFHDAIVEYAVSPDVLSLGAGLTGWSGLSRYASPSIGSLLALDAPLYQQATNGVNDQFIRKLSVYAKGQIGKLDYRLALSNPMTVSGAPFASSPSSSISSFSPEPPTMQAQGYLKYMFMEKESNLTPYAVGTYLGSKKVFNVGAGIIYQTDAMWSLDSFGNTTHDPLLLLGIDLFYDAPIGMSSAFTAYGAYTHYDFGNNYLRHVGVNNPASHVEPQYPGGPGNGFPAIGTGDTFYGQLGYLFGRDFITDNGKIQPFSAMQYSRYKALSDSMFMFELGFNYLIHGSHGSKISFVYQNRPTYISSSGEFVSDARKGMTILQYQISF